MNRRYAATIASVVALLATVGPALALPISYGDFVGTHVTYLDVTEDPFGVVPLFGAPSSSGDSIAFNPAGFTAASVGGGADTTAANLSFSVIAALGSRISGIALEQDGDTTLAGNAPLGSITTGSQVLAGGTFAIHEVDFVPIGTVAIPFSLVYSPSGGSYFLGTDGGGGPIYHTTFSGTVAIDVESILLALSVPFAFGATRISIDWTPTFQAQSDAGTSSVISGLGFAASAETIRVREEEPAPVPEPASLVLTGLGLAALALRRRRKHA